MKTYTVKEIADLLKTKPETVRKWIRNDVLKSQKNSKYGANVITEGDFNNFLSEHPKYAAVAKSAAVATVLSPLSAMLGATAAITGGFAGISGVAAYALLKNSTSNLPNDINLDNASFSTSDLINLGIIALSERENDLSEKKAELTKLKAELTKLETEIIKLEDEKSHIIDILKKLKFHFDEENA